MTSMRTQLGLTNGWPRICGIFGGPPKAAEMCYSTFGNIWPCWCFVFLPATFVWGRILGMTKVMERWRSHLLEGLALGTGQLDGGQQDQALSILEMCIGFKCPPSWFNSLAWQAPSWTMWCWKISSASVLTWDQFKATEDGRKYSVNLRDNASSFQGRNQWSFSFLGSPGREIFPL